MSLDISLFSILNIYFFDNIVIFFDNIVIFSEINDVLFLFFYTLILTKNILFLKNKMFENFFQPKSNIKGNNSRALDNNYISPAYNYINKLYSYSYIFTFRKK